MRAGRGIITMILTQDHLEAIKKAAEGIKFGSITIDINDLANYLEITTTIKERLPNSNDKSKKRVLEPISKTLQDAQEGA
jgi:hypothetical protein